MSVLTTEQKGNLLIVTIDTPGEKVNKLDEAMMDRFSEVLDELGRNNSLRGAILISGKEESFIAGADLGMLQSRRTEEELRELSRRGSAILNRIERSGKPIAAAIHGSCMGGGTELVLACHYRILSDDPSTRIALPEVKLGLIPGMGGTQRLPRLIGIQPALELMLTGKNFYPRQALRNGFADELTYRYKLLDAAGKWIANHPPGGREPDRRSAGLAVRLLEGSGIGRKVLFSQARKRTLAKTRGNYPAPLELIDCVETGISHGMERGLQSEADSFARLGASAKAEELIGLFFTMNRAKNRPSDEAARPVERIGVLGAGLMGSGIAQVSSEAGYHVWLKDRDLAAAGKGRKAISGDLEKQVASKIVRPFERDRRLSRIHAADNYQGFERMDLVIEAVFEDLSLKQALFSDIEERVSPDTVIASNTSSIPISRLAAPARHPERFVGMHYFSPVPKMPLLEVIRTDKTSPEAIATACRVGRRQGKTVIVVNDGPGFYTTRAVSAYMNEALLLFEEGAGVEQIDRAMKDFGFPVGPLTLIDEVGIDIGAHVASVLEELFEQRGGVTSKLSTRLQEEGLLGRKSGRGFYIYPKGEKKRLNPEIESFRSLDGGDVPGPDEIRERLTLVMPNEAVWCLQEGILDSPEDGDLGAVLGLGFPPFTGGPFRWTDREGASNILSRLDRLEEQCGGRFTPPQLLRDQEGSGGRFRS